MALITHVRHIAVAVPRFGEAVAFYEGICGLRRVADDGGVVFLGTDAWPEQYVLRLRRSREGKRVDLVALAARDGAAVDALAERLAAAGTVLEREPGPLHTPGGGYGFRFFDPEGRLLEVSSGVAERPHRALEPGEPLPRRISHIVLDSTEIRGAAAFYERFLGFRITDWLAEDRMVFLRCGTDHHSIAFTRRRAAGLNHVAFEMRGVDECMRGTGLLMRAGRRPLWGPGRHRAGDNVFAYFGDPNDNVLEYTCELQQIPEDCTWVPRVFGPGDGDQWGTAGSGAALRALQDRAGADPGLWSPAPL